MEWNQRAVDQDQRAMELKRPEPGIDLKEILIILWARVWVIALTGIVCALAVGIYTEFYVPNTYSSSTQLYIVDMSEAGTITQGDITLSNQLVNDYKRLIVSRPVTEQVVTNLNLSMSYQQLAGMISVTIPSDSHILDITVTGQDSIEVMKIANAVREEASVYIQEIMTTKIATVVAEATLPTSPSGPNVMKNSLISGLAAVAFVCLIIVLIFMLDERIKTPEDIERYLGISVLGTIPLTDNKGRSKKNKNQNI